MSLSYIHLANYGNPTKKREEYAVHLRNSKKEEIVNKRRRMNNTPALGNDEFLSYKGCDEQCKDSVETINKLLPGVLQSKSSDVSFL